MPAKGFRSCCDSPAQEGSKHVSGCALATSAEARVYGRAVAQRMLRGRKGHGGGPCLSRVMREADLIALAEHAFEQGRKFEQSKQALHSR